MTTPPAGTDAVLVLSGGANLGAVQVGMLRGLLEAGIRPVALVGASVGALNAAALAVDPTLDRVTHLEDCWRAVRRRDVFAGDRRAGAARLLLGRSHLHHPGNLRAMIERWFEPDDLSRTAVPLHVATTELHSGETRWWRAGDPTRILLASTAIPVVFPPVELDGVLHVDGALVEPVGLQRAAAISSAPIVVLDAGATASPLAPPSGAVAMVVAAIRAGRMARLAHDRSTVDPARVTWLRADVPELAYHDFSRTEELIARGRAATDGLVLPAAATDPRRSPAPDLR